MITRSLLGLGLVALSAAVGCASTAEDSVAGAEGQLGAAETPQACIDRVAASQGENLRKRERAAKKGRECVDEIVKRDRRTLADQVGGDIGGPGPGLFADVAYDGFLGPADSLCDALTAGAGDARDLNRSLCRMDARLAAVDLYDGHGRAGAASVLTTRGVSAAECWTAFDAAPRGDETAELRATLALATCARSAAEALAPANAAAVRATNEGVERLCGLYLMTVLSEKLGIVTNARCNADAAVRVHASVAKNAHR